MAPKAPPQNSLTQRTHDVIAVMFPTAQKDVAELLIRQCGNNLPFLEDADALALERVRLAVLRMSEGRFNKLKSAIELSKVDWRDLLMAAGFGEDAEAHLRWEPAPVSR